MELGARRWRRRWWIPSQEEGLKKSVKKKGFKAATIHIAMHSIPTFSSFFQWLQLQASKSNKAFPKRAYAQWAGQMYGHEPWVSAQGRRHEGCHKWIRALGQMPSLSHQHFAISHAKRFKERAAFVPLKYGHMPWSNGLMPYFFGHVAELITAGIPLYGIVWQWGKLWGAEGFNFEKEEKRAEGEDGCWHLTNHDFLSKSLRSFDQIESRQLKLLSNDL